MTKTWSKIVLAATLIAGLGACDSKDSQPPTGDNAAEQGQQTRALLIAVAKDGTITLDKIPVTLDALAKNIESAKSAGPCVIWYCRDKGPGAVPAFVKPIVDVLTASKVPVSISAKPDYSDLVAQLNTGRKQVSAQHAMHDIRLGLLADGPQKLNLQPSAKYPHLFGVMMETPNNGVVTTVAALNSGECSLLTNTNFGILNGPPPAQAAAFKFVEAADPFIQDATSTHEVPYPAPNHIRFYLMTFEGIRVIDQDLDAVVAGKTKFTPLYAAGQAVLSELKKTTTKQIPTTLPAAETPATAPAQTQPATTQAAATQAATTQPQEAK